MNYRDFIYPSDPDRTYSQFAYNKFGSGALLPDITRSVVYQQAGLEGKTRMEKALSMGLPLNTDISRARYEGSNYNTKSPIYSTPNQQPYGTWGAVGGQITEDGKPVRPVTTGKFDTSNSSTPSSGSMPIPAPRRPSSQERANINEVDAREARRQRIRNATQNATIFPYLRSKPTYDLGESRNSPSIFSNYSNYGPSSL